MPRISAAPSDITLDYHLDNRLGRYPYSQAEFQIKAKRLSKILSQNQTMTLEKKMEGKTSSQIGLIARQSLHQKQSLRGEGSNRPPLLFSRPRESQFPTTYPCRPTLRIGENDKRKHKWRQRRTQDKTPLPPSRSNYIPAESWSSSKTRCQTLPLGANLAKGKSELMLRRSYVEDLGACPCAEACSSLGFWNDR